MDMFRLGLRESHIQQRAQGQLCDIFTSWVTDFVVVLRYLRGVMKSGGAQQSAPCAQRLEAASPKLRREDNSVSYSPMINLKKEIGTL